MMSMAVYQLGRQDVHVTSESKPFWQIVADIGLTIPPDELEKFPSDLSINLDHYLYGAFKIEE